jgi:hypothetical protein
MPTTKDQSGPAWALFLAQHKADKEAGIETDPLLDDLIRAAMTYGVNRGHARAAEVLAYLADVNRRVQGKPQHRPPGKTTSTRRIEQYVAMFDDDRRREGKAPESAPKLAKRLSIFNGLIPSLETKPRLEALVQRIVRARAGRGEQDKK